MNHKAVIHAESRRLYRLRSYVLSDLQDEVFEQLNKDGHVLGLNGYCLDALDDLPRGSMSPCAGHPSQNFV